MGERGIGEKAAPAININFNSQVTIHQQITNSNIQIAIFGFLGLDIVYRL